MAEIPGAVPKPKKGGKGKAAAAAGAADEPAPKGFEVGVSVPDPDCLCPLRFSLMPAATLQQSHSSRLPLFPRTACPLPQVLSKFKGEALKGLSYEPLFPYFEHLREGGAFRVVADPYVTADSGVGIVHQAPAFGERALLGLGLGLGGRVEGL